MMEDVKFYEFLLKLNTYLNRTNLLANKFTLQEKEIGECLLKIKQSIPKEAFDVIFVPLATVFENRIKLMEEIREANDGFENTLKEYYEYFKGTVQ